MSRIGEIRSPAAVIVFSIITCGIYIFYWIYTFASDIKARIRKEEINPGLELFLCIICFPYMLYWAYRYGEYLKEAQAQKGMPVDNDMSIVYLIIALCGFFIVDMAIMQSKLNDISRA